MKKSNGQIYIRFQGADPLLIARSYDSISCLDIISKLKHFTEKIIDGGDHFKTHDGRWDKETIEKFLDINFRESYVDHGVDITATVERKTSANINKEIFLAATDADIGKLIVDVTSDHKVRYAFLMPFEVAYLIHSDGNAWNYYGISEYFEHVRSSSDEDIEDIPSEDHDNVSYLSANATRMNPLEINEMVDDDYSDLINYCDDYTYAVVVFLELWDKYKRSRKLYKDRPYRSWFDHLPEKDICVHRFASKYVCGEYSRIYKKMNEAFKTYLHDEIDAAFLINFHQECILTDIVAPTDTEFFDASLAAMDISSIFNRLFERVNEELDTPSSYKISLQIDPLHFTVSSRLEMFISGKPHYRWVILEKGEVNDIVNMLDDYCQETYGKSAYAIASKAIEE